MRPVCHNAARHQRPRSPPAAPCQRSPPAWELSIGFGGGRQLPTIPTALAVERSLLPRTRKSMRLFTLAGGSSSGLWLPLSKDSDGKFSKSESTSKRNAMSEVARRRHAANGTRQDTPLLPRREIHPTIATPRRVGVSDDLPMVDVLLIRHARSVPPTPNGPDEYQRPLTAEGHRHAAALVPVLGPAELRSSCPARTYARCRPLNRRPEPWDCRYTAARSCVSGGQAWPRHPTGSPTMSDAGLSPTRLSAQEKHSPISLAAGGSRLAISSWRRRPQRRSWWPHTAPGSPVRCLPLVSRSTVPSGCRCRCPRSTRSASTAATCGAHSARAWTIRCSPHTSARQPTCGSDGLRGGQVPRPSSMRQPWNATTSVAMSAQVAVR